MITSALYYELICSSCRNTQVTEYEAVTETTGRATVLTAQALGWHISDEATASALCPVCVRATRQCLNWWIESGVLQAGHQFSEPNPLDALESVRRCRRCGWVDDPNRIEHEQPGGLARVQRWHAQCDDCVDDTLTAPVFDSRATAVRALRSTGWTVKVRKDEPVLVRCETCTAERTCRRDGHIFGEWAPAGNPAFETRWCERNCELADSAQHRPTSAGSFALVAGGDLR